MNLDVNFFSGSAEIFLILSTVVANIASRTKNGKWIVRFWTTLAIIGGLSMMMAGIIYQNHHIIRLECYFIVINVWGFLGTFEKFRIIEKKIMDKIRAIIGKIRRK